MSVFNFIEKAADNIFELNNIRSIFWLWKISYAIDLNIVLGGDFEITLVR